MGDARARLGLLSPDCGFTNAVKSRSRTTSAATVLSLIALLEGRSCETACTPGIALKVNVRAERLETSNAVL